ncbi:hypothetical protein SAMN04487906_2823 [Zhouia amylolytica]|uniref:BNR repeat-like domain-containing protein n=1 Tax=Zhouia amylolytica TaxID=376730 RepID=A0A1I6V2K4_9FLAO|nr:hypothetical protein [Zhouia amylolytica]SFT07949.1 hypothetical protein SAMN04487906_2823 [Zhouia amylolytica]
MKKAFPTFCLSLSIIISVISCNSKPKEKKNKEHNTTVQKINFDQGMNISLPYMVSTNETTLMSWVTKVNDSISQLNYATLEDGNWSSPKKIVQGQNWFVNWADYPMIVENNGTLLAHFLKKSSDESFAYDIKLNLQKSQDSTWQTELPLYSDETKTEHGFMTLLPYKEHSFFVTWLDGRNMAADPKKESGHAGHHGTMSIRAAEIDKDGTVLSEQILDSNTCTCCQTTATITSNGPIVLYRDRTDDEIRDIAITRLVDGEWTTPKFIHDDGWVIGGCPVNGPKVDAIGDDVAAAWFTAANDQAQVKVAFSENAGASFLKPILVSNVGTLGRVDIVMTDSDHAIVSWMESIDNLTYLKAMKVNKLGEKFEPIIISKMDMSRSSGFPQMERTGNKILFAWTKVGDGTSEIETASVELNAFSNQSLNTL